MTGIPLLKMKKYSAFLICSMMSLAACQQNGSQGIRVVDSIHYDTSSGEQYLPEGFIEYDSVRFSDGSYVTYRMQEAPMNSLTEFVDAEGRTIATLSQASECEPQVIIYRYRSDGQLAGLLYFDEPVELQGGMQENYRDWFGEEVGKDFYEAFRLRIETMDYDHPDSVLYHSVSLSYDDEGKARKATDTRTGRTIEAPDGYWLDAEVTPAAYFWMSDLRGGRYFFKVCVCPEEPWPVEYTLMRYADFIPAQEETYKDGVLTRVVLYPSTEDGDMYQEMRTRESRDGQTIYKKTFCHQPDTLKRIWHEGRLVREQTISPYGTILEQTDYEYALPASIVRVTREKLDYASRQMRRVEEFTTSLEEMDDEDDEMRPMKDDIDWSNVYE